MNKRVIFTVAIALAAFAAIFGYKFYSVRQMMAAMAGMKPPPITVSAAAVREETWPNTLQAVATLKSFRGIVVKTELEGTIRDIAATSGSLVATGAPLVRLDTSVEDAQLSGLQAQAHLAEINLGRARDLRAKGTNTPSDLDTAEATLEQARSAVTQLKATIAKKNVVAPFSGRLGIVQVYPGQFLSKGDAIVVLESTDPIYVDFSLPQQDIAHVEPGQTVRLTVGAYSDRPFEGKIVALSPRLDEATRSIDIRAELPNADGALRAGMFARAEILLAASEHSLVIPSVAIVHDPYGETVYVISEGAVQQRFIKTGSSRGDLTQVRGGLKVGDQVVTSGQIKLRNGTAVKIDNSAAPQANPAPKPVES